MPSCLHQKLAERAQKEGISLNQYIVFLLSEANGIKVTKSTEYREVTEKFELIQKLLIKSKLLRK